MLDALTLSGGSQMLPPIHAGDDKMKIDDKEPPRQVAQPATVHPAQSYPYHSAPQPPYASYASTSPHEDPRRRSSSTRSEHGQSLDGPLPSLRSVTGIGEALDTTRPPLPPPSTYTPSFAPLPPPPPSATPSFTPSQTSQSPTSVRNYEASPFERRPYEKPTSSYPPQFAAHTAPQATPAQAPLPIATGGPPSQPVYGATTQPAQDAPHWRSNHASPTEPSHQYGPPEHSASYSRYPPSERQDGVYRAEHYAGGAPLQREEAPRQSDAARSRSYGDSVKRHLDHFDLENAFNEIADRSRSLWEFSQHFRNKAHQTQRSGPLPGSTPNLQEIEDMAKKTSHIQASLASLQEVVLSQQAALAERHPKESWKPNGAMPVDEAPAAPVAAPSSASASAAVTAVPVAPAPPLRDGFAGPDTKKKRGRAAPPGRCHSCNRAETPEWRRGPDGARTLCNACGLHYAKLTRKMGNNKASVSNGSNLKPRTMSDAPHPPPS